MSDTEPVSALFETSVTHEEIVTLLERAAAFNMDESPVKSEYFATAFAEFSESMATLPGFHGVFGTGHPFYATDENGTVLAVEEISRNTLRAAESIEARTTPLLGKWVCIACQRTTDLPDLKTTCKPCDLSTVKPRDVLKIIPDLDYWVIVDEVSPSTLAEIEERSHRAGFFQSDIDIYGALERCDSVMGDVLGKKPPTAHLPIDLHAITPDDLALGLDQSLAKLQHLYNGLNAEATHSPFSPLSLHMRWERPDVAYDFTKDLLFSLTLRDASPSVEGLLHQAQQQVRFCLAPTDIEHIVGRHDKERRQLQTPGVREALAKRWSYDPGSYSYYA